MRPGKHIPCLPESHRWLVLLAQRRDAKAKRGAYDGGGLERGDTSCTERTRDGCCQYGALCWLQTGPGGDSVAVKEEGLQESKHATHDSGGQTHGGWTRAANPGFPAVQDTRAVADTGTAQIGLAALCSA